jgi:uncharacterized membrane protein
LVVGIVLLIVTFVTEYGASGWIHWAMIVVGLLMVATAVLSNCPMYSIFGIRTCGR